MRYMLRLGCGEEGKARKSGAKWSDRCGEFRSPRKPVNETRDGKALRYKCVESYKSSGEPEQDNLMLVGEVTLITIENGRIGEVIRKKNTLTNVGREYIAKIMGGLHTKPFKYIQIGTGTTYPTEDDTSLESFYAEKVANAEVYAPLGVFIATILDCTFSFTEDVEITEAGIFDDLLANSPNMLARVVFSPRKMSSEKTLRIRWGIRVV